MIDKLNISEEIDWTTVGLYLLLVIFGWMNIFASSYNDQFKSIFDIHQNYGEQLLWILASFILIILLFAIDHRFYHYFAYVIFGASILLLLSVLAIWRSGQQFPLLDPYHGVQPSAFGICENNHCPGSCKVSQRIQCEVMDLEINDGNGYFDRDTRGFDCHTARLGNRIGIQLLWIVVVP